MNIDIELTSEGIEAAVLTMVLAACADLEVSDEEGSRLREIIVTKRSWADRAGADALISKAHGRVRELIELSGDREKLKQALAPVGKQIGDVPAREVVLALAVQVASSDGLDDDERIGVELLTEAFGADSKRVKDLAAQV